MALPSGAAGIVVQVGQQMLPRQRIRRSSQALGSFLKQLYAIVLPFLPVHRQHKQMRLGRRKSDRPRVIQG